MIPALTQKLVQKSRIVWEERKCLRNRLRGFSCHRCVDRCNAKAIVNDCGKISFNPETCTECGVCTTSCPGDSFSFEGLNLNRILPGSKDKNTLIISCHQSGCRSEHEVRLPCIGALPPEALILLGLREKGTIMFNLSECSKCKNRAVAESFTSQFRLVQKRAGHLFRARLMLVHIAADLPQKQEHDRRKFLFSLGENVAEVIQERFSSEGIRQKEASGARRIPARTQLLIKIIDSEGAIRNDLVEICTPYARVSSSLCTRCPRCTGMCPTGALKIRKDGSEKMLSYDRTLCTACGLCVEFCKAEAISIREPVLISPTSANHRQYASCR